MAETTPTSRKRALRTRCLSPQKMRSAERVRCSQPESYSEMGSEKFSNPAKSGYNKGTIRSDIWYFVVSIDVRRHRLISVSYISHGPCHGRGRQFESRRPRHSFQSTCSKLGFSNVGTKNER